MEIFGPLLFIVVVAAIIYVGKNPDKVKAFFKRDKDAGGAGDKDSGNKRPN